MEKHYIGMNPEKEHEVFKSAKTPTREEHKHAAVMGPFETKRGAEYAAKYGKGNPHIQHVADAERLAREAHHARHKTNMNDALSKLGAGKPYGEK